MGHQTRNGLRRAATAKKKRAPVRHEFRRATRTPEETARLRADRERYQRDKPTPEQLLAEGGHSNFTTMGEFMFLRNIMWQLRKERERQGMTLAQLSKRTKIDQAALSRLENRSHANPTLDTLYRIADALGKRIRCELQDATT
jgi:ribosome-binding protein aMBF1 (putative translation factor)